MASNPFATRFVQPGRLDYQFPEATGHPHCPLANSQLLQRLSERLLRQQSGLIVGPHGSGKSTLVQALLRQLSGRFDQVMFEKPSARGFSSPIIEKSQQRSGSQWLRGGKPSSVPVKPSSVLGKRADAGALIVVDGLEQWSVFQRFWLATIAKRKELTVLATSHQPLRRFPMLYKTRVDLDCLRTLTQDLLAGHEPDVTHAVMSQFERAIAQSPIDNVRELWFHLFDVAQRELLSKTHRPPGVCMTQAR